MPIQWHPCHGTSAATPSPWAPTMAMLPSGTWPPTSRSTSWTATRRAWALWPGTVTSCLVDRATDGSFRGIREHRNCNRRDGWPGIGRRCADWNGHRIINTWPVGAMTIDYMYGINTHLVRCNRIRSIWRRWRRSPGRRIIMGYWPAAGERRTDVSGFGIRWRASPCSAWTPAHRCAIWHGRSTPRSWSPPTAIHRIRSWSGNIHRSPKWPNWLAIRIVSFI